MGRGGKAVETACGSLLLANTPLKRGVNERVVLHPSDG
jgi:hypothetical protein